jgi:hypothetical protein
MSKPRVKRLKTTNGPKQKKEDQTIWQDLLSSQDLLLQILPFVGDHQYRFIGAVNHAFQDAYLSLFPDCKKTYYNVSSIKLAEFCWNDFSVDSLEARCLCEVAAKRNLTILKRAMARYKFTDNDFLCNICVRQRLERVVCALYNGSAVSVASGMNGRAPMRPRAGI